MTIVYVSTDDADVVDRALRDPCYAHFDFHFQEYERLIAPQYSYVDPDSPDFVQFGLEKCQNDRCPVPLTVRGTQALVGFAPLAPSVFCAARQNAVLRRSPLRPT